MNKETLKAGLGAGILGSLCCTLPLLIVALGLGSIGFALGFAKYRPFFILLGVIFLGLALYRYLKKKEGFCTLGTVKNNLSVITTAIIVAFLVWVILLYAIVPLLARFVYG